MEQKTSRIFEKGMKKSILQLQQEITSFIQTKRFVIDDKAIDFLKTAKNQLDFAALLADDIPIYKEITFTNDESWLKTLQQFVDNLSIIIDFLHYKYRPVNWKIDTHLRAAYVAICEAKCNL